MFTHLYQQDHFSEEAVRIYIGEIILALEHLHKVCVPLYINVQVMDFNPVGQWEDEISLQRQCITA